MTVIVWRALPSKYCLKEVFGDPHEKSATDGAFPEQSSDCGTTELETCQKPTLTFTNLCHDCCSIIKIDVIIFFFPAATAAAAANVGQRN